MGYHLDEASMSLDDLRTRLSMTDLIPSQEPLLTEIKTKLAALGKRGVASVKELRAALRSPKSRSALAADSGVSEEYLVLLRRAVEGFFPKPRQLRDFDWQEKTTVAKLAEAGLKDTRQLHVAASQGASQLAAEVGLPTVALRESIALADLSRVQWVSPTFARVLVAAGFNGALQVAKADPEALYEAVKQANQRGGFYKGTVGLRDVRRLVSAAAWATEA